MRDTGGSIAPGMAIHPSTTIDFIFRAERNDWAGRGKAPNFISLPFRAHRESV
jgi:hypothetical protein